jgi:hypothetical protein
MLRMRHQKKRHEQTTRRMSTSPQAIAQIALEIGQGAQHDPAPASCQELRNRCRSSQALMGTALAAEGTRATAPRPRLCLLLFTALTR